MSKRPLSNPTAPGIRVMTGSAMTLCPACDRLTRPASGPETCPVCASLLHRHGWCAVRSDHQCWTCETHADYCDAPSTIGDLRDLFDRRADAGPSIVSDLLDTARRAGLHPVTTDKGKYSSCRMLLLPSPAAMPGDAEWIIAAPAVRLWDPALLSLVGPGETPTDEARLWVGALEVWLALTALAAGLPVPSPAA